MNSSSSTTQRLSSSFQLDPNDQINTKEINLTEPTLPAQFIWPKEDLVESQNDLMEPVVNLEGFLAGNNVATQKAATIVRAACSGNGCFQVINHGVDSRLVNAAHDHMNHFFKLPREEKLRARKKPGEMWGYSGAHSHRFSSKLPWKETLSFGFSNGDSRSDPVVVDFFKSNLGNEFEQTGLIYQEYCEAMKGLSLAIMELLAISLGVDPSYYRILFEEGCSIMRCNYYPRCEEPGLTLGTGPHHDPTSITLLHQDQVGGLEVFVNNGWHTVRPRHDAFVVTIGETFMALSNGKYKSCLHRAVVHRYKERRSLAFFLCPKEDKVLRPPPEFLRTQGEGRLYPDFTWSEFIHFTQNHYRADNQTLQNFAKWIISSKQTLNHA